MREIVPPVMGAPTRRFLKSMRGTVVDLLYAPFDTIYRQVIESIR